MIGPDGSEIGVVGPSAEDSELAKEYWKQYEYARKFDEGARKDYAFCRRYARGDSSYDVSVNLIGTYIDILVSFLYARNPDLNVGVADSAGEQRKAEMKLLAKTMTVVLSRAWKDATMRRQAERWLRSALTVGIGWMKTGWQEEFESDPVIIERKRDIQENLAKIRELQNRVNDGDAPPETEEELAAQLKGLEGHAEKLIYRGIFIDLVPAEDIQVSLDVANIVDCESASWIAHRNYMMLSDAKAYLPDITEDEWGAIPRYHAVKPVDMEDSQRSKSGHVDKSISSTDADRFSSGSSPNSATSSTKYNEFVCVIEMWRGDTNMVCELLEGLNRFASPPAVPNAGSTRFYPFVPLALHEVDGERHPQSLVMRSYKLMDEYNRTRDKYKSLRQGMKPKMAFDARIMSVKDMEKLMMGSTGEYVPVKPAVDEGTVQGAIFQVPMPKIDPALFDLMPIKTELESLWGIQEALSSSISVAKTATEAEIQQAGTNARTGAMRERMENQLTVVSQYHAQITIQKYELVDVRDIAGPEAIWPEDIEVEDLDLLLSVEIAAGSTGKPNTSAQREAWAATAGVIRETIIEVGRLRQTSPLDIADCLIEVLRETIIRAGDESLDLDRFLPPIGQPVMLIDPQTLQPVAAYPAPMEEQQGGGNMGAPGGELPMEQDPADQVAPTGLPDQIA